MLTCTRDNEHRLVITLDVFVPWPKVPEFMAWYEREIGFFPLWSVP